MTEENVSHVIRSKVGYEVGHLRVSSTENVSHNDALFSRHPVESSCTFHKSLYTETCIIEGTRINSIRNRLMADADVERIECVRTWQLRILIGAVWDGLLLEKVSNKGAVDDDLRAPILCAKASR